ncbi:thermonuclease family protein [Roseovarius pelagicus]|uniref:Thermonuclease family protein n=1 Tax=Roseovarius pelagicus TaxID=2980108 RepID=A0ABY6DCW4_9RHOB|nr:thermonuclease family protein [Roseovarius pelagicus]UXX83987.1 thermonuclease family protein [Roseovarius pelagicus]
METLARAVLITVITVAVWHMLVTWHGQQALKAAEGCVVSYVYDGDTVALECDGRHEETARLVGLDTPETKDPGCADELALGTLATERLRTLVAGSDVKVRRDGYDRYGRVLIRLLVEGQDVARTLIRERLALPYTGGTRPDWCARLGAI